MRRSRAPAIPPEMYRHFAVATVTLTMTLAMFAGGENRERATIPVEPSQSAGRAKPARFASPGPTATPGPAPFGWTDTPAFDRNFGSPMDPLLGGDSGAVPDELTESSPNAPPPPSRAERELLLEHLRETLVAAAPPAAT